ncbi:hypothetical protein RchiOBHm_Chr5g0036251 [Rosa chinensis]|uniref:Uncharacterized protein n=1 Tax=Rosa chinensis TaxID=74649 RepID=A0A2P6QBE7_ROSCH|nr:hypothetical protein RchiOBHm_Chr5g0036251 [Rosa chinensis]
MFLDFFFSFNFSFLVYVFRPPLFFSSIYTKYFFFILLIEIMINKVSFKFSHWAS